MSLNSIRLIAALPALFAVLSVLQGWRGKYGVLERIQKLVLLFSSYLFLLALDARFLFCILLVTALTYFLALRLERAKAKGWLSVAVLLLIGILWYFKYTGFFINSIRNAIGLDSVTLSIVLPVGLSFYIFSALSYVIDVYREEYPAEKDFVSFALYIAFFPKLTAGPIVRGKDFFPQARVYRGITGDAFQTGIQIFVFGLFKKIVLADRLGVFVDDVFHAPVAFNTGTIVLAVISYSLQIYFDFSGYSDMAIGLSKILGFDLKPNFNLPYISRSVSEFWKRWHISLSSWFRDFLYFPLGGNRKGKARTYVNLMLVMLVSGLWHGTGWTFLAWGALHGLASCVDKAVGQKRKGLGPWINGILTYIFVTLSWVVFRADSFPTAMKVWTGMFTVHGGISQPYTWSFFAIACFLIGTLVAWRYGRKYGEQDKNGKRTVEGFYPVLDLSRFWSLVVFFTFCGLTVMMGYFGNTAFIYGAF